MRNSCHVWLSDLSGTSGGIQRYSRYFLEALQAAWPAPKYEVFVKNDTCEVLDLSGMHTHVSGNLPSPLRSAGFAGRIVSRAILDLPKLVISGHLHFAVISDWLNRCTNTPYWIVTYGMESWGVQRPFLHRALLNADCVISISRYTKRRLIDEHGLDPDRIEILPCTFDPDLFEPRERSFRLLARLGLQPEQQILLTVARLAGRERYKGYDMVLDALPEILSEVPGLHYVLVGEGSDSERIRERIRDMHLERHVTLTGSVPDSELADYYNICSLFAMPGKLEGFGIVYLEALACGRPVVAGNRDGARDALLDGQLGILVDPDDVTGFVDAAVQVLKGEHPNRMIYDPRALRLRVIERYGPGSFFSRLGEILESRGFQGEG